MTSGVVAGGGDNVLSIDQAGLCPQPDLTASNPSVRGRSSYPEEMSVAATCPPWCTTGPHTDPKVEDRLHLGFFGDFKLDGHDEPLHLIVDQPVDGSRPPLVSLYADPADEPEIRMAVGEAREIGTALIRAADAGDGKPLLPDS